MKKEFFEPEVEVVEFEVSEVIAEDSIISAENPVEPNPGWWD